MTENPYESPSVEGESSLPTRRFSGKSIGGIFLLVAMFPAAGIACFTICGIVAENSQSNTQDRYGVGALMFGMVVGSLCAAALFGVMLTGAVLLLRRPAKRPRIWTSTAGTSIKATLIAVDGYEVLLRKEDGTELRVKWMQLCKADRDWLKGKTL